jgi:uncharacterized membrane protein
VKTQPWRDSRALLAVALGAAGFVLSWYVIHHLWYGLDHLRDTDEYWHYARRIALHGQAPYRDFKFEYPPLSLLVFLLPLLVGSRHFWGYQQAFELMMAACGLAMIAFVTLTLVAQRVGTRRLLIAVAFVAFSPLLLGALLLSRYDLLPAMLTIAALAALVLDRPRTAFVVLALGTAVKAYPAVIVPIAAVYVWRTHGGRKALACLAIWFAIVLACFAPFLGIAPGGVWWSIHGQAARPPQLESLGAALFLAAHQIMGLHVTLYFTHLSDNIDGHPALRVASAMSVLQVLGLLFVWISHARGPATRASMLTASAAAVAAFMVFDRVLSPQYLMWLVPLVAVVPGRRGLVAIAMLAAAMCMTQIWYPLNFTQLKELQPLESWAVVGRDLVLLALFATLALADVPILRLAHSLRGRRDVATAVT